MRRLKTVVVAAAVALSLSAAELLDAQPGLPPGVMPLSTVSKSPAIIRSQLQLGAAYEQQALDVLDSGTSEADTLLALSRTIYDGYVMLRLAVSGVRMKQSFSRFANPLLEMTIDRIEEAMYHVRVAKTSVDVVAGGGDAAGLAGAIDNLEKAIALAELAATLI